MHKMSLKFASNLSFMFTEAPTILERYSLAKEAGFKYVESAFPGFPLQEVVNAKNNAGIDQILINLHAGDGEKANLKGLAAIIGEEEAFQNSVNLTIEYAKALNCKRIHVTAGVVERPTPENDAAYETNLLYAVDKFKKEGITGLIEPINTFTVPNYYMHSFEKGLELVKKINSPHLKLQLDLFHLQHTCGNVTRNIRELLPYVGHIQIAQVPDRHEPDTPGELDYQYILSLLEKEAYNGYIGLEYAPKTTTVEGLQWVQKLGYKL